MADIDGYLLSLPDERRVIVARVLERIRAGIPAGYVEELSYGMIGFVVPLARYPAGYLGDPGKPLPYIALASQKRYLSLYHMGLYADPERRDRFIEDFGHLGYRHPLDMGKSCIRFRYPDEIPYDLIGGIAGLYSPDEWIALYESRPTGPGNKGQGGAAIA